MSVSDETDNPWIVVEKEFIQRSIREGKGVFGICLGAQLIASALGSKVYPGKNKEIGWFQVNFNKHEALTALFSQIPDNTMAFHWHGDTFNIPEGAVRIAESKLFPNQGYIYNKRVLALQFHLEVGPSNIEDLVENCRHELIAGPYIQPEKELLDESRFTDENRHLLFRILDYLAT